MSKFKGRLGIVQRVLPRYRAAFFDLLAEQCTDGLGIFAGAARQSEHVPLAKKLDVAKWTPAENMHLLWGPLYLCVQKNLIQWLDDWDPDILIVEANPRYVSTAAAIETMKYRMRPVVGWGLGAPAPNGLLSGFRLQYRKRFLAQFDAMIAYSQRGAAEYRAMGFPAERVFVAPNAVATKPTQPKKPHTKSNEPVTLLYVGRLQKRKRLDALIRACASLPKNLRPALVIVGEGPARGDLEKMANVVYPGTKFSGAQFGGELDESFDKADLFILPGTGGLAIQQAMAQGLPIIAAEGDGSQEDMVQPDNGWLLPPRDDAALRRTLKEALSNPRRLQSMGTKSFELARKKFNVENMVENFVDAVNQVTS